MSRGTSWGLLYIGAILLHGCIAPKGSQDTAPGKSFSQRKQESPSNLIIVRDPQTRLVITLRLIPPWTPQTTQRTYRFPLNLISTDPAAPVSVEVNAFWQRTAASSMPDGSGESQEKKNEASRAPKEEKIGSFRGHWEVKKSDGKNTVVFDAKPDFGEWVLQIKAESERVGSERLKFLISELVRNIRPGATASRLA